MMAVADMARNSRCGSHMRSLSQLMTEKCHNGAATAPKGLLEGIATTKKNE